MGIKAQAKTEVELGCEQDAEALISVELALNKDEDTILSTLELAIDCVGNGTAAMNLVGV